MASTVLVCVSVLVGCESPDAAPPISPVTVTVTSTPSTEPTAYASAGPSRGPRPGYATLAGRVQASMTAIGVPVGLAVAPVGGQAVPVLTLGDRESRVAWSTIKVPLAVAAQRASGRSAAEAAAIVNSDNASAEQLWASLGAPDAAAAAVTEVLREGGDDETTVPSQRLRPGFTVFGQTVWSLPAAATFTAHLECMPGTQNVVSLMGSVAGNQQWGVETMSRPASTAVKGGWGPGESSGYLVRQIGLIRFRDGSGTAVAMSAVGSSMASGIAALNTLAATLNKEISRLPRGRCAA